LKGNDRIAAVAKVAKEEENGVLLDEDGNPVESATEEDSESGTSLAKDDSEE
jgi:hypothetical protein